MKQIHWKEIICVDKITQKHLQKAINNFYMFTFTTNMPDW